GNSPSPLSAPPPPSLKLQRDLRGERKLRFILPDDSRNLCGFQSRVFPRTRKQFPPLPGGEGRGEGKRSFPLAPDSVFPSPLWILFYRNPLLFLNKRHRKYIDLGACAPWLGYCRFLTTKLEFLFA